MVASGIVAWNKRSPKGLYVLAALILIGLSALRAVGLDRTVERTYPMSWQVDALKTDAVNMRFVDFPTYVERIQSKDLLEHLSASYVNKTVPVTFEILYEFDTPKRQRMIKVGDKSVSVDKGPGVLWLESHSGGRSSEDDVALVSPWDKP